MILSIHHLGGTGGTVISRHLGAHPRVVLVSEVHPTWAPPKTQFAPFDLLSDVAFNASLTPDERTKLFCSQLAMAQQVIAPRILLVRDYSWADFILRNRPDCSQPTLACLRQVDGDVRSCVTVRHPLASYCNRLAHNDMKFSFSDYCRRILLFLDTYRDVPVFKYEKFVENPAKTISAMFSVYGLNAADISYEAALGVGASGNSGRGRSVKEVMRMPQRAVPVSVLEEAKQALQDQKGPIIELINRLDYQLNI